ncbi:conserved hypothetical protein [Histoplasma capsulatum var. duboisii H88]|uniref:GPI anchored protein n=2 Tax=Ajellomyces capsulatus TaxID=5037 RepID=F0UIK3_AJEC8|nr:conserved hypothetical protein [Histoplasma capsulatum H143]EGC46402.1 conserved hypothetical protein [Histoplasma capsulatum var. duboisii H88]QSS57025.1 hypothetical protein I7I53_05407 [Histoplasma capsulatum var. duboisii H88]
MRPLASLLPQLTHLLLLALYANPTSANSCIGTQDLNICCPGTLSGGVTSNGNGKTTAHGICCIDPSTIKRRSTDANDNINIIDEAIPFRPPLDRRQNNRINLGASTCGENEILIPLSAPDYASQVSSVMASISGESSSSTPEPTGTTNTNTKIAGPAATATNSDQESRTTASTTATRPTTTTTTALSTGGMPAATGQRSYVAAIGGVMAAAVLVAGGL